MPILLQCYDDDDDDGGGGGVGGCDDDDDDDATKRLQLRLYGLSPWG